MERCGMPRMPSALTHSLTSACSRLALANTKCCFKSLSSASRHMAGYAVCRTRKCAATAAARAAAVSAKVMLLQLLVVRKPAHGGVRGLRDTQVRSHCVRTAVAEEVLVGLFVVNMPRYMVCGWCSCTGMAVEWQQLAGKVSQQEGQQHDQQNCLVSAALLFTAGSVCGLQEKQDEQESLVPSACQQQGLLLLCSASKSVGRGRCLVAGCW